MESSARVLVTNEDDARNRVTKKVKPRENEEMLSETVTEVVMEDKLSKGNFRQALLKAPGITGEEEIPSAWETEISV